MVWDLEAQDEGLHVAPQLLAGSTLVAILASAAGVVGIVNDVWRTPQVGNSTEAMTA
jgi:hypothetical protein